jgi:hypothetical protein
MKELPEEKSMWAEKLKAEQPDPVADEDFSPALTMDDYYRITGEKKDDRPPLISIKL